MADAPYTTGNDILQYQGNANLAVGSGAANAPIQIAPLGTAMSHLQDQEASEQMEKYRNKVKDRDNLAKMLSATNGSIFNMKDPDTGKDISYSPLPDDRETLTSKADAYTRAVLANIDRRDIDPKIIQQKREFDALSIHAQKRAYQVAADRQEMVKSDNEEDRRGYSDNIQNEVLNHKLEDFHQPEPYLPALKIDPSKVYNDPNLYDAKESFETDPTTQIGYKVSSLVANPQKLDIRPNILNGVGAAANQASITVSKLLHSPASTDPNFWSSINNESQIANQKASLFGTSAQIPQIPIDPTTGLADSNFVKGILLGKDPVGTANLYYTLTAPSHAIGRTTKTISEEGDKHTEALAKIKHEQHQDVISSAKVGEISRHNRVEEAIASAKVDKDGGDESGSVTDVLTHMNNTRQSGQFHPASEYASNSLTAPVINQIREKTKQEGIDLDKYSIAKISANDQSLINISGIQPQDEKGSPKQGSAKTPQEAFYLKSNTGNPADDRYVVMYDNRKPTGTDKKTGKQTYGSESLVKIISPVDAVEGNVKSKSNFTGMSSKTTDKINKAQDLMRKSLNSAPAAPTYTPSGKPKIDF